MFSPTKKITKVSITVIVAVLIIFVSTSLAYSASPTVRRTAKKIYYTVTSKTQAKANVKLAVPYHKQEHALSCEVASLLMALQYYEVKVSESDLIRDLNFDTKQSRTRANIWGDPDLGFVGNIDGKIPNGGYGVYEQPILKLALLYRYARVITGIGLTELLKEVEAGHPVIVWGCVASCKDISWQTASGKNVKAVYSEHTRLLIGFTGTAENPKSVILQDPIYGTIYMTKQNFLADWAVLDNKAVVVY